MINVFISDNHLSIPAQADGDLKLQFDFPQPLAHIKRHEETFNKKESRCGYIRKAWWPRREGPLQSANILTSQESGCCSVGEKMRKVAFPKGYCSDCGNPSQNHRRCTANQLSHHEEQMEAERAEFDAWWLEVWPKMLNMGWSRATYWAAYHLAWTEWRTAREKKS